MPYVDLAGLSRFAGKSKDFASSAFAGPDMANWQKTAAAGAVSFLPVPEMPLDPVVNFVFTETGPASGTKGPDNPSTITGVTQAKVTRCGKNLIKAPYYQQSGEDKGITYTVNQDGSIVANGTATGLSYFYVQNIANSPFLHEGMQYTLSGCPAGGSTSTYFLRQNHTDAPDTGTSASFTAVSSGVPGNVAIVVYSGTTVSNLVFRPQLELGSVATSFEPYEGADYTVNLGGTYYGGSVDLSTGVMTVNRIAVPITEANKDTDGWNSSVNCYVFTQKSLLPAIARAAGTEVCTHFIFNSAYGSGFPHFYAGSTGQIFFFDSSWESKDDAIDYFAAQENNGTPVLAVYEPATPITVPLTPTQIYSLSQPNLYNPRINTVYSDQISVQVGYPKSPQATQNELTNAVVSLGGNV